MAPTLLIESLEMVRRRVRWLGIAFGAGLVLSAAVGLLLFTVLADYLLNLNALPRLVLISISLGAIGYTLWHFIIQSILAKLTLNEVAGRLERTFPQYQDRLRSTIDILSGNNFPGSEIMKQRVVSEAARLTQSLDLSRVVVLPARVAFRHCRHRRVVAAVADRLLEPQVHACGLGSIICSLCHKPLAQNGGDRFGWYPA